MSDDEEDYLSDKFLANLEASHPSSSTSKSTTYSDLRKQAAKQSQLKQEANRKKSQKEVREEGLKTSLFERAAAEKQQQQLEGSDSNGGGGNKALSMMMKMGFKPGEALGKRDEEGNDMDKEELAPSTTKSSKPGHITEPLPLLEWEGVYAKYNIPSMLLILIQLTLLGRKGIGTKRRAASPLSSEQRVAKMAKMAEDTARASLDYRMRTKQAYEEKRAEGRLGELFFCISIFCLCLVQYPHSNHSFDVRIGPAQRTCINLDEKAGKSVRQNLPLLAVWLRHISKELD